LPGKLNPGRAMTLDIQDGCVLSRTSCGGQDAAVLNIQCHSSPGKLDPGRAMTLDIQDRCVLSPTRCAASDAFVLDLVLPRQKLPHAFHQRLLVINAGEC